jgi:serine/threonine-protein kinase
MEFLEGRTVADELVARGRIPPLQALGWTCQLLRALSIAHASRIVHRDIRPCNLFLCDSPDGLPTLKVVDFGLTRILPDAPPNAPHPLPVPTDANVVIGAPRYISPEGAQGEPVDHRADLYAAALVLYTMLAGHGPFDHHEGEDALLFAHATEAPQPPSRFLKVHAIPAELDSALLLALRKDPDKRFQTADAFREALEDIQGNLKATPQLEPETNELENSATEPPRSAPLPIARNAVAQRRPEAIIGLREAVILFLGTALIAAVAAVALIVLRGAG